MAKRWALQSSQSNGGTDSTKCKERKKSRIGNKVEDREEGSEVGLVGGLVVAVAMRPAAEGGFATCLQFGEDLGEVSGLAVDAQHLGAQPVDDEQAPVPELVLAVLHEEGLQRIADLVAHVAVGQVQARQHRRLELALVRLLAVNQFAHQHVHEHDVRRVDEGHVLQTFYKS